MKPIEITKENFEEVVLKSNEKVLVDFWASWCGPCRMVGPVIDEIAEEATTFKVGKINVDEQQELAQKYGVMSIPTIAVFENGQVVNKVVGARGKEELLSLVKA